MVSERMVSRPLAGRFFPAEEKRPASGAANHPRVVGRFPALASGAHRTVGRGRLFLPVGAAVALRNDAR